MAVNNVCIFMGRVTADPEMKTYGDDGKIANFALAVNRPRRQGDEHPEADFPRFTAFGKTAEFVENYIKKGTQVLISSHLQMTKYTDKEGQTRTATDFIVDDIRFAEGKRNENGNQNVNNAPITNAPKSSEDLSDDFPLM